MYNFAVMLTPSQNQQRLQNPMQRQGVEQIRAIVKCNCISNQLERLTINMAFNKCTNLQWTLTRNEYFTELVTELIPIRSGTHGQV